MKLANARSRVAALAYGVLCVVGFSAVAVWSLSRPIGPFDDGIQLTGSMLALQGLRPNVDFDFVYPPLNAYILAGAFRWLGESVATFRLVQTAALAAMALTLAYLLRNRDPARRLSALALVVATTSMLGSMQIVTSLMWSALAVVLLLRGRSAQGHTRAAMLVLGGICYGALLMSRLNFAAYFAVTWLVDSLWMLARERKSTLRDVALEGLTFFVPSIAVAAIVLVANGSDIANLLYQVAYIPSRANVQHALMPLPPDFSLSGLRHFMISGLLIVPLPAAWLCAHAATTGEKNRARQFGLACAASMLAAAAVAYWATAYLPFLVLPLLAIVLLGRVLLRTIERDEWFLLLLLTLEMHYTLTRMDGPHFFALFAMAAALMVAARNSRSSAEWLRVVSTTAVVFGVPAGYHIYHLSRQAAHDWRTLTAYPALLRSEDEVLFQGCREDCGTLAPDPDLLAAVSMIRANTAPSEPIFSGLQQNTIDGYNDTRAYFLARRPAATRRTMMMGGITTGAEIESQIVDELRSQHVEWLLLWKPWLGGAERTSTSAGTLDGYIQGAFQRHATFGAYEVWRLAQPT